MEANDSRNACMANIRNSTPGSHNRISYLKFLAKTSGWLRTWFNNLGYAKANGASSGQEATKLPARKHMTLQLPTFGQLFQHANLALDSLCSQKTVLNNIEEAGGKRPKMECLDPK
ncbi:hypothetical protein AMTR_s00141p00023790 [Amborella trichopoda]|uniref:Uncharacterized protein n=1 Tax=Amborella trichopoda TaxID=13333 RepID=W1PH06_AMBTC|nr:hypothetical protein AMTR_s00141p00023790 [Amborella trichopoda]